MNIQTVTSTKEFDSLTELAGWRSGSSVPSAPWTTKTLMLPYW